MKSGFPPECSILQPHIKLLWSVRESLHIADQDVLMYGDRVIIPSSLQGAVLKIVHSEPGCVKHVLKSSIIIVLAWDN